MTTRRQLLRTVLASTGLLLAAACAPAAPPAPPTAAPKPTSPPLPPTAAPKPTDAPKPAAAPPTQAPAAAVKPTEPPKPAATIAPAAKAGTPVRGGSVVWALGSPMATQDPTKTAPVLEGGAIQHAFEGLTRITPDGQAVPLLAERWEAGADGLTWTFSLRRGVRFHDGTAFNAEAVKVNIDRVVDRNNQVARGNLEDINGAKVVDENTVQITTSSPYGSLPLALGLTAVTMVSPAGIARHGEQLGNFQVDGTGPFKISSFKSGQELVMVRNPEYWGTPAYLDQLTVRPVPDDAARVAMLLAGEAQFISYVAAEQVPRLQSQANLDLLQVPSIRQFLVQMNTTRPEFQDARVRRALNHAVDKAALVRTLYGGLARVGDSGIGAGYFGHKALMTYDYDVQKAAALFAEAGWTKGADGMLQKAGQPLEATLRASRSRYPKDAELAEAVGGYLRTAGVKLTLQIEDFATWYAGINTPENHSQGNSMVLTAWGTPTFDGGWMVRATYGKDGRVPGSNNMSQYTSSEVDALGEEIKRTTDATKQKQLIDTALTKVMADAPAIFLLSPFYLLGRTKTLQGAVVGGNEQHSLRDAWLERG